MADFLMSAAKRPCSLMSPASFDFDEIALLAKVFDVVNQQQLNTTVLALGETFEH